MRMPTNMRTSLLCLAGAALIATGCAYDDRGGAEVGYGYGPGYTYDGYYDDYYGPFYDGYWAPDGFFYYSDGEGHPFRRDAAQHFRHDSAGGFHAVHGGRAATASGHRTTTH